MPAPQRLPAKERMISEIGEGEIRVTLVGTVVGRSGKMLSIDDGTGKIDATFEDELAAGTGELVRLTGRVIPLEGGAELQGEACSPFPQGELETWRKASALWEKSLGQL